MRIHYAAAAAALLTGVAPAVSAAPPRTYCNLVPGHADYEHPQEAVLPGSTQDARIKNGDIATNATHLTAVVRLRTTASTDPTKPVQGLTVMFWFHPDGAEGAAFDMIAELGRENRFWLERVDTTSAGHGPTTVSEYRRVKVVDAVGVYDTKRAEVRMTVPLSVFRLGPGGIRKGTKLRGLGANVARTWGDFPGGPPTNKSIGIHSDGSEAPWHVYYPVGAPSCLAVGR